MCSTKCLSILAFTICSITRAYCCKNSRMVWSCSDFGDLVAEIALSEYHRQQLWDPRKSPTQKLQCLGSKIGLWRPSSYGRKLAAPKSNPSRAIFYHQRLLQTWNGPSPSGFKKRSRTSLVVYRHYEQRWAICFQCSCILPHNHDSLTNKPDFWVLNNDTRQQIWGTLALANCVG